VRQRIYIDTSIVGGFFDEEFEKPTRALFARLERQEVIFVTSNLLISELEKAPKNVRIAIATINKVDILASWNFKHIVNINRIRGYNSVNIKNGYAMLEIRNPKELIEYEN
jgi:predicted nucleic acid-binding protein